MVNLSRDVTRETELFIENFKYFYVSHQILCRRDGGGYENGYMQTIELVMKAKYSCKVLLRRKELFGRINIR